MDKFEIECVFIFGIGVIKKVMLEFFGIEMVVDVSCYVVLNVLGFGFVLMDCLMKWW